MHSLQVSEGASNGTFESKLVRKEETSISLSPAEQQGEANLHSHSNGCAEREDNTKEVEVLYKGDKHLSTIS